MSTAWAAWCTRCSPASRPTPGPPAQAIIAKRFSDPVPRVRRVRPSVPEQRGRKRSAGRSRRSRPTGFATAAEFAQRLAVQSRGVRYKAYGPASPAAIPGAGRRRRVPVAAIALGLGILIGARRAVRLAADSRRRGATAGAKVLAVLPFENLGDSADAYFADGVSDEVRGKLSQLAGPRRHCPGQLERVPAHHASPRSRSRVSWARSTC